MSKTWFCFLPVEKISGRDGEGRHSGKARLRRGVPDLDDAVDVAEGERLEENLVDDGEDGGVGSDAEGHDDGCDQGKARVFLTSNRKSESQILQEC